MNVYIDGENFRKGLTRILLKEKLVKNSRDLHSYPIRALLSDVLETDDLEIFYYASRIKLPTGYTPDDEIDLQVDKIREFNRKWVPGLQKQNIIYVKAGYLKVKRSRKCPNCGHSHESLQEKGVDVRLAVDMLEEAYSRSGGVMALMSSDTDLCPLIHRVQTQQQKVIYVCFADSVNRAVSALSDETVTISIAKIKKYTRI